MSLENDDKWKKAKKKRSENKPKLTILMRRDGQHSVEWKSMWNGCAIAVTKFYTLQFQWDLMGGGCSVKMSCGCVANGKCSYKMFYSSARWAVKRTATTTTTTMMMTSTTSITTHTHTKAKIVEHLIWDCFMCLLRAAVTKQMKIECEQWEFFLY